MGIFGGHNEGRANITNAWEQRGHSWTMSLRQEAALVQLKAAAAAEGMVPTLTDKFDSRGCS